MLSLHGAKSCLALLRPVCPSPSFVQVFGRVVDPENFSVCGYSGLNAWQVELADSRIGCLKLFSPANPTGRHRPRQRILHSTALGCTFRHNTRPVCIKQIACLQLSTHFSNKSHSGLQPLSSQCNMMPQQFVALQENNLIVACSTVNVRPLLACRQVQPAAESPCPAPGGSEAAGAVLPAGEL